MTLFQIVSRCAVVAALSYVGMNPAYAQLSASATAKSTPGMNLEMAAADMPVAADPAPIPFISDPSDPGNSSNYSASPAAVPSAVVTPTPALTGSGGLRIQGVEGESVPWSIVLFLTGLTLIPSLLLCVTPFARLLIVFHFLRQALGLQTTPSNQTLIGLSLILTYFLMQPVGSQIYQTAVVPMQAHRITAMEAVERGQVPLRKFMLHYVREKDVALFVSLSNEPRPAAADDISMRVLLPAYIVSELKAGFQIGTVLFLPFLIVDMVVASITTSVGMLQLPPVVISTPLKLLLFLMVDGWHLLIGSLMRSFN